jgi:hypothetical protein
VQVSGEGIQCARTPIGVTPAMASGSEDSHSFELDRMASGSARPSVEYFDAVEYDIPDDNPRSAEDYHNNLPGPHHADDADAMEELRVLAPSPSEVPLAAEASPMGGSDLQSASPSIGVSRNNSTRSQRSLGAEPAPDRRRRRELRVVRQALEDAWGLGTSRRTSTGSMELIPSPSPINRAGLGRSNSASSAFMLGRNGYQNADTPTSNANSRISHRRPNTASDLGASGSRRLVPSRQNSMSRPERSMIDDDELDDDVRSVVSGSFTTATDVLERLDGRTSNPPPATNNDWHPFFTDQRRSMILGAPLYSDHQHHNRYPTTDANRHIRPPYVNVIEATPSAGGDLSPTISIADSTAPPVKKPAFRPPTSSKGLVATVKTYAMPHEIAIIAVGSVFALGAGLTRPITSIVLGSVCPVFLFYFGL